MFQELSTLSSQNGAVNEKLREHFLNHERFDEWAYAIGIDYGVNAATTVNVVIK